MMKAKVMRLKTSREEHFKHYETSYNCWQARKKAGCHEEGVMKATAKKATAMKAMKKSKVLYIKVGHPND